MPPVFGPGVAVADALVVLGDRQRSRHPAIAQGHQAAFRPDESLLDDDRPELGEGHDRLDRVVVGGRHDDALAGSKADPA